MTHTGLFDVIFDPEGLCLSCDIARHGKGCKTVSSIFRCLAVYMILAMYCHNRACGLHSQGYKSTLFWCKKSSPSQFLELGWVEVCFPLQKERGVDFLNLIHKVKWPNGANEVGTGEGVAPFIGLISRVRSVKGCTFCALQDERVTFFSQTDKNFPTP